MKKNRHIAWRRVDVGALQLDGWKVAVVGGTGGLGRAIARALASRGAAVTVIGRTFRDANVAGLTFASADLASMREAARAAGAARGGARPPRLHHGHLRGDTAPADGGGARARHGGELPPSPRHAP